MRRNFLASGGLSLAMLALVATTALAASKIAVEIPFSFIVKDREMPAGRYEIEPTGADGSKLVLRSTAAGGTLVVVVLERLADTGAHEPRVVFDKFEAKNLLSEVHIPGMDGFLVGIAKGKETHVVLTGGQ